MMREWKVCVLALSVALWGCPGEEPEPTPDVGAGQDAGEDAGEDAGGVDGGEDAGDGGAGPTGTVAVFDPGGEDFFDTPFPSDAKLEPDGSVKLSRWTRAYSNRLIKLWFDAGDELLGGWSLTSGSFVNLSGGIDASSLPDWESSVETSPWPSVAVVDVDPDSPERGKMFPITCEFNADAGRLRVANQLGCRSPFGTIRRPNTTYALVITGALKDEDGEAVVADEAMAALLEGQDVTTAGGVTLAGADYVQARDFLVGLGAPSDGIALLDLFTTGDPVARKLTIARFYDALPQPTLAEGEPIEIERVYDDYTLLRVRYEVPIVQEGPFPYANPGEGKLKLGADGEVEQVGTQLIRVYVTVPRGEMPAGGWPLMMYMHGSGGEAEEGIDLGERADFGEPAEPGTGPALVAARYGVAAASFDFQFHGTRFDPPDTSGLVLYNLLGNPRATVDNFLVAANEVGLHMRLLAGLELDPAQVTVADGVTLPVAVGELLDVGGAADGLVRFDSARFATMGLSMGSTIGTTAMTLDRTAQATILTGAGASLVEIASTSTRPLELAAALRVFLGYRPGEELDQFDPILHAIQHVWDYVDPMVHARHVTLEPHPGVPPKHVFMHSGLTDGYFSPASREALSLALEAPLAGEVLEESALEKMSLVGLGEALAYPVSANVEGKTYAVVQYEPNRLDGHVVAFQRDDTKAQYGCFLKTMSADGAPRIVAADVAGVEACGVE